jgi:dihydrofolate reductase
MIGIAAISENLVIGKDGKLPWSLPEDLKWFRTVTMGHVVCFGRNTAASVGNLKGRDIRTLTRTPTKDTEAASPLDIVTTGDQKIFLAGGAQIYEQYLHLCSELYITHVSGQFEGDTFFPVWWDWGFNEHATLVEGGGFTVKHYLSKNISLR